MALVAKGQITLVDLADGRSVQAFIETFTPQIQIYSPETQRFDPDWSIMNPVLIPSVYMTGTTNNLINRATVKWFKNGVEISSSDSNYVINPNTKTLTIKKNDMENESYVDYSVEVTIKDTQTGIDMASKSKINFAKVESGSGENAQNAFLTFPDGSVFKNASPGETKQIVLEYYDGGRKIIQNLDIKWFYQEPSVKEGDPNYHEDGGEGWSLISDTNNKNNGIRGYTGMNLTVSNHAVEGTESFKAVVQYGTKDKVAPIGTMIDITDPHQVIIEGNLAIRPEIQSTILFARTFLNGEAITDLSDYKFSWYIYGADGELSKAWTQNSQSVEIEREDVPETGHIIVEVLKATEKVGTGTSPIFKVEDGQDGEDGKPGEDGAPGKDGEPGQPGKDGEDGKDGVTYYTWVKYADTPTTGMSDSPDGKTYIGLAYNRIEETPSTRYQDYKWSLIKGKDGVPGPPGLDGKPKYTWIKYADDENGVGISDSPKGKKYLGLAHNKDTAIESDNPSDYVWSLMQTDILVGGVNLISGKSEYWEVGAISDGTGTNASEIGTKVTLRTVFAQELQKGEYVLTKYTGLLRASIYVYNSNGEFIGRHSTPASQKRESVLFELEEDSLIRVTITALEGPVETEDIKSRPLRFKLESGNASTDWSPAIEDQMSAEEGELVFDWLAQLEDKTDASKIVETILTEPDFEAILNQKANTEDLEGLATGDMIQERVESLTQYVDGRTEENSDKINQLASELERTAAELTMSFKSQGGTNLIYNSLGWADLDFWTKTGEVSVLESDSLTRLGYGRGFVHYPESPSAQLTQDVQIQPNEDYSISFWLNKPTVNGSAGIEIWEGNTRLDDAFIGLLNKGTNGYELATHTFKSITGNIQIRIKWSNNVHAVITGLMLNRGVAAYHWQHAEGEIYNTNIKMNLNGITVKNEATGGYTVMSPQEFSGYAQVFDDSGNEHMEKIFTLNGETTEVKQLQASELFRLDTIEIRSDSKGWTFVSTR